MIISGTGHRPNKLGGYSEAAFRKLVILAKLYLDKHKPEKVISGMALGWDQALAQASIELKIPFIAAVPFDGFHLKWPKDSKKYFYELLENAEEIIYVSEGEYQIWKLQKRNEWMVDNSEKIIALWDGTVGGTANCINYAKKKNKPIINLYDFYLKL